MKRIIWAWVVAAVCAGSGVAADSQTQELRVEYRNDKLSVRAEGVPASSVLAEVSRATGSRILGLLEEPGIVTTDFSDVPMQDGLQRLLGSQPFALRYRGESLISIQLVDRGKGGKPIIVYPTPARSPSPTGEPLMVSVSGPLAARIGASRTPLTRVVGMALGDQDASIRTAASRAIVSAIDGNPALRDEFIATYGRMADEALVHLSRAMPGAREFFDYVSKFTKSRELREKAAGIVRTLQESQTTEATGEES